MNNIRNIAIFLLFAMMGFYACEEGERFGISSGDTVPPGAPKVDSAVALPGGARIYYKLPADEDLISIEASFTTTNGKVIKSAVSFFAHHLDIYGLPDTLEHTIQVYAVDRAGNKSEAVPVKVNPLEPTYSRVAKSLEVYPAFGSLLIAWKNELGQDVNVFVDFSYSENGTPRSLRQAYSSRDTAERKFIKGLNLPESEKINVQVTVEDIYGNHTEIKDIEPLRMQTDEQLKKSDWVFPLPGTAIGGSYMSNGNSYYGNIAYLNDGNINDLLHPGQYAIFSTAYNDAANHIINSPATIMIDLGAKYELSRIVTHQARFYHLSQFDDNPPLPLKGNYYGNGNIGRYDMFRWEGADDGSVGNWILINRITLPQPGIGMPAGMTDLEIVYHAELGDESMMYPEKPDFTPATRWFKYVSVAPFLNNYSELPLQVNNNMAELTLYGRKAN
jgi:hypothetical protein